MSAKKESTCLNRFTTYPIIKSLYNWLCCRQSFECRLLGQAIRALCIHSVIFTLHVFNRAWVLQSRVCIHASLVQVLIWRFIVLSFSVVVIQDIRARSVAIKIFCSDIVSVCRNDVFDLNCLTLVLRFSLQFNFLASTWKSFSCLLSLTFVASCEFLQAVCIFAYCLMRAVRGNSIIGTCTENVVWIYIFLSSCCLESHIVELLSVWVALTFCFIILNLDSGCFIRLLLLITLSLVRIRPDLKWGLKLVS